MANRRSPAHRAKIARRRQVSRSARRFTPTVINFQARRDRFIPRLEDFLETLFSGKESVTFDDFTWDHGLPHH